MRTYFCHKIKMSMLCFIITYLLLLRYCIGQTYQDETRLLGYLFENGRYDKFVRPVTNRSDVITVDISHQIKAISNVNLDSWAICSFSHVEMSWIDEQLIWDPQEYGGISTISLPHGKYWMPNLKKPFAGACTQDEKLLMESGILSYNGKVLHTVYEQLGALCIVDMTYFPFDEHVCIHQFYSLNYPRNELAINLVHESVIGNSFQEHQEWDVSKAESFVMNLTTSRQSTAYSADQYTIKRRSGFILFNNFVPAFLLMALHLFVPFIPPNTERLSFAITTYLALMFINISLIADMPRNSVKIIMLSYCLLVSNIFATLELIWSIFIVSLSATSTDKKEIPKFLLRRLGNTVKKTIPLSNGEKEIEVPTTTANSIEVGWYEVSRYLDKVYFVVSLLLASAMFSAMIYMYSKRTDE